MLRYASAAALASLLLAPRLADDAAARGAILPSPHDAVSAATLADPNPPDPRRLPGWPAYVKHCSGCHGEEGDGQGVGARFLDPPPRDFGFGRFRFISTENAAPSGKDLFETIGAGLAGTSMLPFAHLGEEDVWRLVDVVTAFRDRGVLRALRGAGLAGEALATAYERRTKPVAADDPAPEPLESYDSAARGLVHYRAHCAKCHGVDGRGGVDPSLKAEEGHLDPAPDLTRGVYKQSPLKRNWFDRIRLGLPGSAMPSLPKEILDDQGVWDLVHYLRTLGPLEAQLVADAAPRPLPAAPLVGAAPATPDDERFRTAPETWIPLVPFRRAEWTTPGVLVRALYDDETVFFRVVYPDPTENDSAATDSRPATPPDGLAVRLTATPKPPVLPYPGQIPPIDRALWMRGPMPPVGSPLFDPTRPFSNPERVCKMVFPPERAGDADYRGGAWHVVVGVRTTESGGPRRNRVSASFAVFDGAVRRGPAPTAFSHWSELSPR
jgi:mono/diheme cytochrome c family protein